MSSIEKKKPSVNIGPCGGCPTCGGAKGGCAGCAKGGCGCVSGGCGCAVGGAKPKKSKAGGKKATPKKR